MRKLTLFFLFVTALYSVSGQSMRFSHYNLKEGLSQSTVNDIVQDRFGFMWFATQDGLNRYDGVSMTVFNDNAGSVAGPALTDREILCLHAHEDGNLYVGTDAGGLNVFNSFTGRFKAYKFSDKSGSISSNKVQDIATLDDHRLLICTDEGLDILDIKSETFERIIDGDSEYALDFRQAIAHEGKIYIATYGDGLLIYDFQSESIRQYIPLDESGDVLSNASRNVRSLHLDTHGRMWVGFQGESLALFNLSDESYTMLDARFDASRISSIMEDQNGVVWFGTNSGLARLNDADTTFDFFWHHDNDPFSLADDYVLCLFEDEAQTIWCGTNAGGISAFHRTLGRFNHIADDGDIGLSLPHSTKVFGFEEDGKGNIWVATLGGGIASFDLNRSTSKHYLKEQNQNHNSILCLEYTSDERIWLGSYGGGVNSLNLKTGAFSEPIGRAEGLPSSTILSLVADPHDNLWIGTYKGLSYYDRIKDTIYTIASDTEILNQDGKSSYLPSSQITCIYLQKGGVLWMGTEGGVVRYNSKSKRMHVIDEAAGLSNNSVYAITADADGMIWVGTKSGLNKVDPNDYSVEQFTSQDGLQSNFIYGILVDRNNALWLSTNNGITRFNIHQSAEDGYYVRHYNEIDGLQGDEFNQGAYFKNAKGRLFFGGVNGFNHFKASDIVDNPHKPSVVIRSFRIMGKEYALDTTLLHKKYIELSYKDNFISFEFAALDFVQPEKNMYMYKMKGVDSDWSQPTKRNYASYTGLPGGDYVFMVKAANNDGVWSEKVYKLHIHIIPPFWKTTWFYTVCVIVIILGIILFVQLRMRKIKREKKILEDKVSQRTRELASKSEELAEKNRDIMDSIEYAKKIQTAILPDTKFIEENLDHHFVLYKPKDIVSGDFYWFGVKDRTIVFTAVDCTGHGVPGAFMSMIGSNLLNQIVLEKGITKAGDILHQLNAGVQQALKQGTDAQETNDGMDIALCTINVESRTVEYAGAYNPLYWISGGELTKIKANKYPIGGAHMELERTYDTHSIEANSGDMLYMFSDGFVDQFGGEKGKKFMGKRFQRLLLEISAKPLAEQKAILENALLNWMGSYEQVDDICVIGIRI